MSGELGRYWWSSVWARILRRGGGPAVDQIDSTGAEILELAAAWPLMPCIFDPATPLDALTYLSLDTEATGLDPAHDSIVSIATVPIVSGQIDLAGAFDCLVNPGRLIPAEVAAIHGITDAMVTGVASFAGIADRVLSVVAGSVAVGHHIGFDFALLRREAAAAARQWHDLPALDTMLLAAVIWPRFHDLSLDAVARQLRVKTVGRHTARGDAIITAEVFLRMLPLLRTRGILTLGAALAAQDMARRALLLKIKSRQWRWRWI